MNAIAATVELSKNWLTEKSVVEHRETNRKSANDQHATSNGRLFARGARFQQSKRLARGYIYNYVKLNYISFKVLIFVHIFERERKRKKKAALFFNKRTNGCMNAIAAQ